MAVDRLNAIISRKKEQNGLYRSLWDAFRIQFREVLDKQQWEELEKHQIAFLDANEAFFKELAEPRVTLATTGTTSSGKSSLVNLLCGEEIMPVAVQEMSAGVVVIEHNEHEKSVEIKQTTGALWECGTWKGISGDDIRIRLTNVMDTYNKSRNTPQEPQCPQIHLVYPTRIGLERELLGLPKNFKIKIMDLPGLKYVGDEGNSHVIRRCREALAIVTYNSFETDPIKQEKLLGEVVNQVKEIGGSPARMLFVLNRIDAFRSDHNWPETEIRFIEDKKKQIRQKIAEQLPEYALQAEKLEVIPLSTQPALYAHISKNSPQPALRHFTMRELEKKFGVLIPDVLLDELPRRIEQWSSADLERVSEAVWKTSHAENFQIALKHHISDHLPEILFPPLLKRFVDGATQGINWSDQQLNAMVALAENRYEEECLRITKIRQQLESLREKSKKMLLQPLQEMSEQSSYDQRQSAMDRLGDNLEQVGLSKNDTASFQDWSHQFGKTIEKVFDPVYDAVLQNSPQVRADVFDSLPKDMRSLLDLACRSLLDAGYAEFAEKGRTVDFQEGEADVSRSINIGLNYLATALAPVLRVVLEQVSQREKRRIYESMERIFEGYRQHIAQEASKIAPDIVGLTFSVGSLGEVSQDLSFSFHFEAGFPKRQKSKQIQTGTEKVKSGTKDVKKKETRWYTLWLYEHEITTKEDVYEDKPVYAQRSYTEVDIPSMEAVIITFMEQAKQNLPKVEKDFAQWLYKQFFSLTEAIENYHERLMSEYRLRLDDVKNKADQNKKSQMEDLYPLQTQLLELKKLLPQIQRMDSK